MLAVVCIAAALLALWCLLLLPRRGQPGWEAIGRARYARRGLHDASRPENSLSAFRAAFLYFFENYRLKQLCAREAERSIHKIRLIVHHNKSFHAIPPFRFFSCA